MRPERLERLALLAILLLAAYLRLNHLGWTEYKLDEANLSRLSLNLVRGIEFPFAGLGSSTGIVNLPLAGWLLAIPYAVSPSPLLATGFVAALNVLAVFGCYALARRWLPGRSRLPALLATLLFAAAPWAVIHSRKIWAQDLLPPFVVMWAWTGWLAFVERRSRALLVHALALAACIHLHYSGLWLVPVSLVWAMAFARRVRWKTAPAAVLLLAASFAPFILADALRGGQNLARLAEIARGPAVIDDQALHLAWLMITGQEMHSLAGPQEFETFLASIRGLDALTAPGGLGLSTVLGLLVLVGAAVAAGDVIRAARRRAFDARSAAAFMLATWLALPIVLQSRHSLPVYTHYFIILYPAPFMLAGFLFARLTGDEVPSATAGAERPAISNLRRAARWGIAALVLVLSLAQSIESLALQAFVAARATPGGFGMPVEMTLQLADTIARASRDLSGAEALIYTEGDNPRTQNGPAVLDVLLPPDVPRRFVDLAGAAAVFPREAAVIGVYSPSGLTLPESVIEQTQPYPPESVIALRAGEAPAQLRDWPGQTAAALPCGQQTALGGWQNGVELLSVEASGDWRGSGGWLRLCYRVGAGPASEDYHWFTHVMGPDGQRWAQVDKVGFPSSAWRPGDVAEIRFGPYTLPADAPIGPYTLRVGMYTYPEVLNVPRLARVDSATDYVEIGLDARIR